MKTVALVGFADTSKEAPFNNKDIEIWSLNDFANDFPRIDRWFEMHDREIIENHERTKNHLSNLQKSKVNVYMQEKHKDIPNSKKYPQKYIKKYGNMFGSTFDYMLLMAIEEGYERIEVYGCDMAIYTEYSSQRPTFMYWMGYARALGIDVWVHPDSGLITDSLYGYRRSRHIEIEILMTELSRIRGLILKTVENANYTDGVINAFTNIRINPNVDLKKGLKELKRGRNEMARLLIKLDNEKERLAHAIAELAGVGVTVLPPDIKIGR